MKKPENPGSLTVEEFVERVTGRPSRVSVRAFVAAITGENQRPAISTKQFVDILLHGLPNVSSKVFRNRKASAAIALRWSGIRWAEAWQLPRPSPTA